MSTVRYCSSCGSSVQPNFQFCTTCGTAINRPEDTRKIPDTVAESVHQPTVLTTDRTVSAALNGNSKKLGMTVGGLILLALVLILGPFKNLFNSHSGTASQQQTQNKNPFTRMMYDTIAVGMTYDEVTRILGYTGEEMSSNRIEGVPGITPSIDTKMYQWVNSDGTNMNAIFQNNKLVQKAQWGLR